MTNIRYYHMRRDALIDSLGGECYLCGSKISLEFHHVDGNGNSHSIGGWQQLYKLEYELGNDICQIQLLCHDCHQRLHNGEYKGDD